MKPSKIAAVSLLAAGSVLLAASASAQPGPGGRGNGWGPGMMMGPGMMGGSSMCSPRAAGMAEWRANRIESAIKLTDPQRDALKKLTEASAKAAETMQGACPANAPAKALDRMAAMEKRAEASLQAIKTVRPAFEAFYNSLDDQQKSRLDSLGPRRWGWDRWHRR